MFQIGDTLISEDILSEEFVCNLSKCKGICCVDGDSGAPLDDDELEILDQIFDKIKPYLREEGIQAIEEQGKYVKDFDDEWVTPLVNGNECAYVVFDVRGMARCGIDKAVNVGFVDIRKYISVHLIPVRYKVIL